MGGGVREMGEQEGWGSTARARARTGTAAARPGFSQPQGRREPHTSAAAHHAPAGKGTCFQSGTPTPTPHVRVAGHAPGPGRRGVFFHRFETAFEPSDLPLSPPAGPNRAPRQARVQGLLGLAVWACEGEDGPDAVRRASFRAGRVGRRKRPGGGRPAKRARARAKGGQRRGPRGAAAQNHALASAGARPLQPSRSAAARRPHRRLSSELSAPANSSALPFPARARVASPPPNYQLDLDSFNKATPFRQGTTSNATGPLASSPLSPLSHGAPRLLR